MSDGKIGIVGLERIKKLEKNGEHAIANMLGDYSNYSDKINEIIDKVNRLIEMKEKEISD
jgi:hypothetical protein